MKASCESRDLLLRKRYPLYKVVIMLAYMVDCSRKCEWECDFTKMMMGMMRYQGVYSREYFELSPFGITVFSLVIRSLSFVSTSAFSVFSRMITLWSVSKSIGQVVCCPVGCIDVIVLMSVRRIVFTLE